MKFWKRMPSAFGSRKLLISTGSYRRYWTKSLENIHGDLFAAVQEWVPKSAVVWDIGANLGVFTFAAAIQAQAEGRVYAFEADVEMAAMIARSLSFAGPDEADVCICPFAVGATNSEGKFSISGYRSAASSLAGFGRFEKNKRDRTQTVPIQSVDSLSGWLRAPTVLKIDVEGAENLVLEGAKNTLRTHRPVLLLEASGGDTGVGTTELLRSLDYVWKQWGSEGGMGNQETCAWGDLIALPSERAPSEERVAKAGK